MSENTCKITESSNKEECKSEIPIDKATKCSMTITVTSDTTAKLLVANKNEYILIYGCSGHGKSTLVNYLLEKNGINNVRAETSSGNESCTQKPTPYSIDKLSATFLDTMGTHDPKINNTSEVNMKLIDFLIDCNVKIKYLKVIYTYQIDEVRAAHIDNYLKNLSDTLKTTINPENVIILLTKAGEMKEKKMREKVITFRRELKKYPYIIPWESVIGEEIDNQYEQLLEALSTCKPTKIGFMDELEKSIDNKAKEIWENDTKPVYYIMKDGHKTEVDSNYTEIDYVDNDYKLNEEITCVETLSEWKPVIGIVSRPIGWTINKASDLINDAFGTKLDTNIWTMESVCRETIRLHLDRNIDYDYYKENEELFAEIKEANGCVVKYAFVKREGGAISLKCKLMYPSTRIGSSNFATFKIHGIIRGRKKVIKSPHLITEYHRKFSEVQEKHYAEALVILGNNAFNYYKKKNRDEIIKLTEIMKDSSENEKQSE